MDTRRGCPGLVGGVNVAVTIRRWSIVRGRPERGSSASPAIPLVAYRSRQPITVGRDTPTVSAIAVFDTPSAANSTIRARCARPARIELERVHPVSSSRSPSRNPNAGAGRFATPHDPNNPSVNQLDTRGTSGRILRPSPRASGTAPVTSRGSRHLLGRPAVPAAAASCPSRVTCSACTRWLWPRSPLTAAHPGAAGFLRAYQTDEAIDGSAPHRSRWRIGD